MLFTTLTIARFRPLLYSVFNDFGGAEKAWDDTNKDQLFLSAISQGSRTVGFFKVRAPLPLA
jgi:hypothetical protein